MEDEIEILKSIYFDDIIRVDLANHVFEMVVYPLDDEQDKQKNLRLNMITYFTENYPHELPRFEFKHIKGIIDEDLETIKKETNEIAEKNLGVETMFEIIQHIKEKLTTFAVPKSCNCSICLYDFLEKDSDCLNLECYHYFHSKCLIKHMIYMRQEIERERQEAENNKLKWNKRSIGCPVCRNPMKQNEIDYLNELNTRNNVSNLNEDISSQNIQISNKTREMQAKMKLLFEKQKNAGGIIEDKKEEIIILNRPTNNQNNEEISVELIATNIQNNL